MVFYLSNSHYFHFSYNQALKLNPKLDAAWNNKGLAFRNLELLRSSGCVELIIFCSIFLGVIKH